MDLSTFKRISLIIGFLLIVAVVAFGLYKLFWSGSSFVPVTVKPTSTGKTGTLPPAGQRTSTSYGSTSTSGLPIGNVVVTSSTIPGYYQPNQVEKISNDAALFPMMSPNGELVYHNAADGKFYRLGPDGKPVLIDDKVFYNVKNVTWASQGNKAVIEYPDDTKIIYNFDTKKQTTLPKHWEDFSFSPSGSTLAAKSVGMDPQNRWLVTTKDDGTGTQLIEPLGENQDKVTVAWSPSGQTVALSQTGEPQGADRREVLLVGLNGENFKSLIVEGLDFQPKWSTTGQKLLYSVDSARSDFKPELWVANAYGDSIGSGRQMLGINTWANKCAFVDDTSIVCGVPRTLPEGAGMSPEIAADTPDDLYRIDLKTGIRTPISLSGDHTIDTINYDSEHGKIMFTDHHEKGIFEVGL